MVLHGILRHCNIVLCSPVLSSFLGYCKSPAIYTKADAVGAWFPAHMDNAGIFITVSACQIPLPGSLSM